MTVYRWVAGGQGSWRWAWSNRWCAGGSLAARLLRGRAAVSIYGPGRWEGLVGVGEWKREAERQEGLERGALDQEGADAENSRSRAQPLAVQEKGQGRRG